MAYLLLVKIAAQKATVGPFVKSNLRKTSADILQVTGESLEKSRAKTS